MARPAGAGLGTTAPKGPVKYLGYTSPKKLKSKIPVKAKGKKGGKGSKTKPPTKPPVKPPPTPPTPPDPLLKQAKADAQLQYGNQILREQGALHNAGAWFDTYKADSRAAAVAAPAAYNAAATAGSQAPTVGPAVTTPEGQQAAASRGILDQNWKNYAGAQGAAQSAYFTGRAVVGSAQQLASRQSSQAKIAKLATDKDAFQIERYGKLQEAAHAQQLQDSLFQNTADKTAADIAAKKEAARIARVNARTARIKARNDLRASQDRVNAAGEVVNAHGYTAKAWAAMPVEKRRAIIKADRGKPATGTTGLSPAEIRARAREKREAKAKTQDIWNKVIDTAAAIGRGNKQQVPRTKVDPRTGKDIPIVKNGKKVTRPLSRDEILDAVRSEDGRTEDHLIVALAIRHHDRVWDARTRAAAKRLGLKTPKSHQPRAPRITHPGGY